MSSFSNFNAKSFEIIVNFSLIVKLLFWFVFVEISSQVEIGDLSFFEKIFKIIKIGFYSLFYSCYIPFEFIKLELLYKLLCENCFGEVALVEKFEHLLPFSKSVEIYISFFGYNVDYIIKNNKSCIFINLEDILFRNKYFGFSEEVVFLVEMREIEDSFWQYLQTSMDK